VGSGQLQEVPAATTENMEMHGFNRLRARYGLKMRWTTVIALVVLAGPSRANAESTDTAAPAPAIEVREGQIYAEPDGHELDADVYLPPGEGPFPGAMVVHGGAWLVGSKSRMRRMANRLAERGYVAVAINYRLAPKHKFPAQLDDCRAALCWMRDNAETLRLDPGRIAGVGYSAGAHLVTLLALSSADTVHSEAATDAQRAEARRWLLQAVVAGGTPTDFQQMKPDAKYLSFWLGGTRAELGELYRRASPIAFATPQAPPTFLFHGEKDLLVPLVSSRLLKTALDEAGAECELLVLPKIGHLKTFGETAVFDTACDFLDRHLKLPPERQAAPARPAAKAVADGPAADKQVPCEQECQR
jgi:acetyl esterase/lipase